MTSDSDRLLSSDFCPSLAVAPARGSPGGRWAPVLEWPCGGDRTAWTNSSIGSVIGPLIGPLIGIDEAGRGPLAGPVCAAAVQLPETFDRSGLTDSKRLSPRRRAGLAQRLKAEGALWALGWAQPAEIDRHNILAATHLAMARALDTLVRDYGSDLRRDWVLIDGNRNPARFPAVRRVGSIVKGDQIVAEISAASILAKTERDAVMEALDDARPGYGFAEHKGYPTATHLAALTRLGPSDAHRQSFAPVARVSKGRVNR